VLSAPSGMKWSKLQPDHYFGTEDGGSQLIRNVGFYTRLNPEENNRNRDRRENLKSQAVKSLLFMAQHSHSRKFPADTSATFTDTGSSYDSNLLLQSPISRKQSHVNRSRC
jgi:hypothetical protein